MVLNAGIICGLIVIVSVAVVAHCPAAGVKVYVVGPAVAVLIVAGLHVPLIPLVEVAGKAGAPEFWHSGPIAAKVGVTALLIVISMEAADPHCPAAGVKVYVVGPSVEVLITAGLQVPVIPLLEVVGSTGAVEF